MSDSVENKITSFDKKINEIENINEIHEKYLEYSRLFQRLQRNGDLEEKKKGRKPVSPETKRATYERTLQRKKEARAEKALQEGRVYARGRPVKISTPTFSTCIQV